MRVFIFSKQVNQQRKACTHQSEKVFWPQFLFSPWPHMWLTSGMVIWECKQTPVHGEWTGANSSLHRKLLNSHCRTTTFHHLGQIQTSNLEVKGCPSNSSSHFPGLFNSIYSTLRTLLYRFVQKRPCDSIEFRLLLFMGWTERIRDSTTIKFSLNDSAGFK